MKVKIKDITLGEIKAECNKHQETCGGCPFYRFCGKNTALDHTPDTWDLLEEEVNI